MKDSSIRKARKFKGKITTERVVPVNNRRVASPTPPFDYQGRPQYFPSDPRPQNYPNGQNSSHTSSIPLDNSSNSSKSSAEESKLAQNPPSASLVHSSAARVEEEKNSAGPNPSPPNPSSPPPANSRAPAAQAQAHYRDNPDSDSSAMLGMMDRVAENCADPHVRNIFAKQYQNWNALVQVATDIPGAGMVRYNPQQHMVPERQMAPQEDSDLELINQDDEDSYDRNASSETRDVSDSFHNSRSSNFSFGRNTPSNEEIKQGSRVRSNQNVMNMNQFTLDNVNHPIVNQPPSQMISREHKNLSNIAPSPFTCNQASTLTKKFQITKAEPEYKSNLMSYKQDASSEKMQKAPGFSRMSDAESNPDHPNSNKSPSTVSDKEESKAGSQLNQAIVHAQRRNNDSEEFSSDNLQSEDDEIIEQPGSPGMYNEVSEHDQDTANSNEHQSDR